MKIVVIGGHLTPALAVIEQLRDHDILYIGRKYALEGDKALSLEYRTMVSMNIKFQSITTGRLQRKFTLMTIPSLLKLPVGFIQSLFILRKFKPDRVVGFGGYVEIPVVFSAFFLRIPIVLHEQTLGAGLANKICSFLAKRICISWESSAKKFSRKKIVLTGNPIRKEIIQASSSKSEINEIPIIYITGGSLGSHSINVLVEKSLDELLKNFRIIHQTGDARQYGDFERLEEVRKGLENKGNYLLKKFLNAKETAQVLQSADLVVSRAGMNTVTELLYLNKPCFLIPLPLGREQKLNALFVKNAGLAEIANQDDLSPTIFTGIIESMIKNIDKYKVKESLIIEDAKRRIAEVVLHAV